MQPPPLSLESENSINREQDILIVGAGPGGLVSALLLAHSGLKVRVIEKTPFIGGRTRIVEHNGFKFDRGPTFFHYPEVIEEIFQAIGRDAHEELGLIPLDPSYRLVFGRGGSIDASSLRPQGQRWGHRCRCCCRRRCSTCCCRTCQP